MASYLPASCYLAAVAAAVGKWVGCGRGLPEGSLPANPGCNLWLPADSSHSSSDFAGVVHCQPIEVGRAINVGSYGLVVHALCHCLC